MAKPIYRNHAWYIESGWSVEPRERFKAALPHLEHAVGLKGLKVLDVGCATGEFLGYLSDNLTDPTLVGVDYSEDLLSEGRRLLPAADFRFASAIQLPNDMDGIFDVVTSIGVMSIFDAEAIEAYWQNLLRVCRTEGVVIVLAPLNEYGIDTMIQHRKRMPGRAIKWETGWNIFSFETIAEIVEGLGHKVEFHPFQIPFPIERSIDPVRTWTIATDGNKHQLTNGIKLLINHVFMVVRKR